MSETRHNPCATCGTCCSHYVVTVTGHDLWRISMRQRLSPEQFVVALPQQPPAADGFRLEPGGRTFNLALDKQGRFKPSRPCVFLLSLGGGHRRCGIYADRPAVCQAYPMAVWSGVVFYRPEAHCPPHSWPLSQVVRPAWRQALQRLRMQLDVFGEVNRRWNARVDAAAGGGRFALREYVSYVMNVYDDLATMETALGSAALERIQAAWPNLPRTAESLDEAARSGEGALWLDYLRQAREVIDRYYPGYEPVRAPSLAPDAPQPPPAMAVADQACAAQRALAHVEPEQDAPQPPAMAVAETA